MNFFQKFDRLEVKTHSSRRVLASFMIGIFGMILVTVGSSYAYLTYSVTGEKINYIQAGTLVLNFGDEGSSLTMTKAVPQTSSKALALNDSYTFKLSNTGSIATKYQVKLKSACVTTTTYTVGGTSIKPDVCIPLQYIRVGIKTGNEAYQIVRLDQGSTVLAEGVLDASNTSEQFQLKMWLSEDTPNDYQGLDDAGNARKVLFVGNLQLYGEQATTNLPAA